MQNLQESSIQCPYCGEIIDVFVDCSVSPQEYIEDCSVCCRPINFTLVAAEGEIEAIEVRTDDE